MRQLEARAAAADTRAALVRGEREGANRSMISADQTYAPAFGRETTSGHPELLLAVHVVGQACTRVVMPYTLETTHLPCLSARPGAHLQGYTGNHQ